MIGLTVVGKPAATVITSSPGRSRRSPSLGEVSAETRQQIGRRAGVDQHAFANPEPARELASRTARRSGPWSARNRATNPPAGAFRRRRRPGRKPAPAILAGHEGARRKGLRAVLAHQVQNLPAQLVCYAASREETPDTRRWCAPSPCSSVNSGDQFSIACAPFGAQILVADFVDCLVAHIRLERGTHRLQNAVHQVAAPSPGSRWRS